MPDNQVFTNPSNSHCSMSQPVQNLNKFSFRIKSFSALSVDRRLLLLARMSPAVLKTRSLSMLLVGHTIKRQRQPLAGCVIQDENIDRFLFAYFCEASSVNTACGNSVSCIKGINRRHNRRAAGSRRAGTCSAAAVSARAHCRWPATSIDRLHRQIFTADSNC